MSHTSNPAVLLGNLGAALRIGDFATGQGYVMYSRRNALERFGLPDRGEDAMEKTPEHIVAVKYNEESQQWEYDNNGAADRTEGLIADFAEETYNTDPQPWLPLELEEGDVLIAEIDFDAKTAEVCAPVWLKQVHIPQRS